MMDEIEAFKTLPLPIRMRLAADAVRDARDEYHRRPENSNSTWLARQWSDHDLRTYATAWEAAEKNAATREAEIHELATVLAPQNYLAGNPPLAAARRAYEAGWRKTEEE